MQKVRFFLLLLGLCWFSGQGVLLYAQEEDDDEDYPDGDTSIETDWDGYISDLYSRGDQTFTISLGVIFPTVFHNYKPEKVDHHFSPPVGGAGSLAYTYFLGAHYFLGIEVGVNFNNTLAKGTVFIIPVGVRTGWQFILHRFEFPITLTVGAAPQRYLDNSYTGLFIKLEGSGFFRFSPEWSFGLNVDWNWYPQWPLENGKRTPAKDMYANIVGLTLAARYHF
jgi:hypothetical protein